MYSLFAFLALIAVVSADLYLHTPRGSNNRYITENDDVEVDNNNRLFDSQNNDDGGYDTAAQTANYKIPLQYYQGSRLSIEWASQHGCGKDSWVNCEMVLQYRCDSDCTSKDPQDCMVRDGSSNDQVNYDDNNPENNNAADALIPQFGLHESWYEYNACHRRQRNMGLFIADRYDDVNDLNPDEDDARYTRQNNDANRSGLECTEERDYYPYWAPSGWKDIAILTNDVSRCEYYWENSQNTNPKFSCVHPTKNVGNPPQPQGQFPIDQATCTSTRDPTTNVQYSWRRTEPHFFDRSTISDSDNAPAQAINKPFWGAGNRATRAECVEFRRQAADGVMTMAEAEALCTKALSGPECRENRWQRDNALGTVYGGFLANYTWVLPDESSSACVFRIRYNISTGDYDSWRTYSSQNGIDKSPVEQDPYVTWNWKGQPMHLALNTNQYGRTFQDRSHVFAIIPRTEPSMWTDAAQSTPAAVPSMPMTYDIHNVGVRGKRGLITQVYPSTTFSFSPQFLHIRLGDFVHFQWQGGSTVPSFNWGAGREGTERHNLVQIENMTTNFPLPIAEITMLPTADASVITHFAMAGQEMNPSNCQTLEALLTENGYVDTEGENERWNKLRLVREDEGNCMILNQAPATFHSVPIQFNRRGAYYYMSARDNTPGIMNVKGAIYVE